MPTYDISEELSGQIQRLEELDYFENLARLIENMEFLSDQNPVLVETLLGFSGSSNTLKKPFMV